MSTSNMKKGLLLLNLGTPDSVQVSDVRRYLAEFLMDPYVIDIPTLARVLLVYGIILPFRPKKSAEAYEKIFTERGSPLMFHLLDLSGKVSRELASQSIEVYPTMRYGNPSVASALAQAKKDGVTSLTVLPLYPQYSLAATESSLAKVREEAARAGFEGQLSHVPAFYDARSFILAFSEVYRATQSDFAPDHVLFSFHGIPERHIHKAAVSENYCLATPNCCDSMSEKNGNCYRAQCFATARALAMELGMSRQDEGVRYSVAFQSRLGRTPWIRPYTDEVIPELAKNGVRKLAVFCPAFVSDCLETIEEIGMRGKESFLEAGGIELRLVPSLNSSDAWARAIGELLSTAVPLEN